MKNNELHNDQMTCAPLERRVRLLKNRTMKTIKKIEKQIIKFSELAKETQGFFKL